MRVWSKFGRLATGLCGLSALVCGLLAVAALTNPTSVRAQEDDLAAEAANAGKEEAAPAAAPAAPAAAGAPAASAPPAQKSQLRFFYDALGLKYVIAFLALSFTFVALIVMNVLTLRRSSIVPLQLVEAFEAHLNEKRYQE